MLVHDFVPDVEGAIHVATDRTFVPLLPPGDEGPPAFFAKLTSIELARLDETTTFEGVLSEDALPNDVRIAYEDWGYIADRHWVLDVGETPESQRRLGLGVLGVGAVLALLAMGYWATRIRGTL